MGLFPALPVRVATDNTLNFEHLERLLQEWGLKPGIGSVSAPRPAEPGAGVSGTVTSLPSEPLDGQTINYVADATNGIIWRLRYRAASASTHKWEFIGGAPMFSEVVTAETTASGVYVDLATVGPSVTAPLAGDYNVRFGVSFETAIKAAAVAQLFVGAIGAGQYAYFGNPRGFGSTMNECLVANVTASTVLKLKYAAEHFEGGVEAILFGRRKMSVTPVRVG